MRVVVFCFSIIFLITSCKTNNSNEIINKAINTVIKKILANACESDSIVNSDDTYHITLSKELPILDASIKDIKFVDFNLQGFMIESRNIEYNLKSLPKLKNIEIHLVDRDLITNKAGLPFIENIHFQYNSLHGNKYCKSVIISNPRILITNKTDCKILLKAVRYYEYPIEETYYLIEIINNNVSFSQLEIISEKIILH